MVSGPNISSLEAKLTIIILHKYARNFSYECILVYAENAKKFNLDAEDSSGKWKRAMWFN